VASFVSMDTQHAIKQLYPSLCALPLSAHGAIFQICIHDAMNNREHSMDPLDMEFLRFHARSCPGAYPFARPAVDIPPNNSL